MSETIITKIKGDWREVVDDCRATVGKESLGKEPSTFFKRRILIAEHSPIRDIHVKWRWLKMPEWIAVHWSRHKFEKYIETQRTDRTGSPIPRGEHKQGEPQNFTGDANCQNLIDAWRKRLCRQASPETRAYAEDFKIALHDVEPELSDVLVPNCVYRGGCPEMQTCGIWRHWRETSDWAAGFASDNIQTRYDAYNSQFWWDHSDPDDKDSWTPGGSEA